jgi:hypothetical protein
MPGIYVNQMNWGSAYYPGELTHMEQLARGWDQQRGGGGIYRNEYQVKWYD